MQFGELAKYLEKLEGTSSRNEMTVILAEMFVKTTPSDARLVAYLTAGRLGPAYNSPDFGVADKMMIKALGEGAEKLFKQKGDLGLVAHKLGQDRKRLTVVEVCERLNEITQTVGAGSQEKKQRLIGELVADLDGLSARYVTRIILGKLRTGFSDMTVLDSLSWMITGDKKMRPTIEQMYNVRADLGEIVEELVKYKKPHEMTPEIGIPILMAKCERASRALEIWERNGECAVEYKLDGLRVQAHIKKGKITLFSRGLENVTTMYPDIVAGLLAQVGDECIVEGEMIAVDKSGKTLEFKKTMNRKRKYGIEEKVGEIPMAIFLFDVLWIKGKSVIALSNRERWGLLEELVKKGSSVKLMPRIVAKSAREIDVSFSKALKEGMEGIVAKRLDAPYTPGNRDFSWIKMKTTLDSVDVVVMGYSAGEGKRTGFGIGEFLVGVYDPKGDKFLTVSKVGSGATDKEWVSLRKELEGLRIEKKPDRYVVARQYEQDYWVRPKLVLEIVANEISESPGHSSGYGLRFPRLISWREKKPEDATTVDEVKSMYTSIRKSGEN